MLGGGSPCVPLRFLKDSLPKGSASGGFIVVVSFIEPLAVADTFASGVARVEPLGNGLVRLTFYARRASLHENATHGEIVARIVIPISSMIAARPSVDMAAERIEGAVGDILVTKGRATGH